MLGASVTIGRAVAGGGLAARAGMVAGGDRGTAATAEAAPA
jgi:hypothetical protein